MALRRSSRVARNNEVLHASAGEELVMMSIEAGNYYGLDPIGRRIWEIIGEPQTVSGICARLIAEYDVPPEVCECEVLAFLSELAEQRIIDVVAN
jgi:hypothetical protein